MTLETRIAETADLPRIQELWRNNPVGGDAPFYHEGLPDKPGYGLYGVHREDRLVGTFSVTPEPLGDRPGLYLSDVVMDRSLRRRGLIHGVLKRFLLEGAAPEANFVTSLIPRGNHPSRRLLDARLLQVRLEIPFEVCYLPSWARRSPETTRDLDQVCDLANRFYRDHAFYRKVTPAELAHRRDFEVAACRRNGSIIACVGIWNQRYARRLMVTNPGFLDRCAIELLGLWNRAACPVRRNGAREVVAPILTEAAFLPGEENAFLGLLGSLGWRRNAHAYQVILDGRSPLAPPVKKRAISSFQTLLFVFQTQRQSGDLPPAGSPAYFPQAWA